jgi:hypothetical protein
MQRFTSPGSHRLRIFSPYRDPRQRRVTGTIILSRSYAVFALAQTCALVVSLMAVTPAGAASSQSGASLIKVNRCNPQKNPGTPGGYAYGPGYTPGYYPRRAYSYNPGYYNRSYYQPPVSSSAELAIDFVNLSPHTMKTIDFGLVANGKLVAIVRDEGTFSQGAEIKHKFGISPNVFPISTGLPVCTPLHVVYQNGTTWTDPELPPDNPAIYTAPPK